MTDPAKLGCRCSPKFGTLSQCADCPAARAVTQEMPDEPEDALILDEAAEFLADHIVASQSQLDAMLAYAVATHAIRACVSFGRMLFTSEHEQSGKTAAMTITAALSASALDISGTSYALQSALAEATNQPEKPVPTLMHDEISDKFGRSGLGSTRDPVAAVLKKGYKRGAVLKWSVNRVYEEYSIFTPFLMTGLRTAVPADIRSRCIVIPMAAGTPRRYFDIRESEPEAEALSEAIASAVARHMGEIAAFRARGIHPKLTDRRLEVWEPLLAACHALGGKRWLNRCLAAFLDLSAGESSEVVLTPRQKTVRDAAQAASRLGRDFTGGMELVSELKRLGDPRYERSGNALATYISHQLPVNTVQRTVDGAKVRGYYTADIIAAWDRMRPASMEDAEIPQESNPFDVSGEARVPQRASAKAGTGSTGSTGTRGFSRQSAAR